MNVENNSQGAKPKFLENAGETGEIIRHFDWENSSLGPIHEWPGSLCTALGIVMNSAFPMFLFWGPDHICFYNDAYRPSLGESGKHPAIGKRAIDVWPEIWETTIGLISQVYRTGKPQWFENRLIPIARNGRLEDVYWTFSHSAVYGDDGCIQGVLVTSLETTPAVVARQKIEEIVLERTAELEQANASVKNANAYLQDIINSFKQPLQVLEPVYEGGEIVDFRFKLTNQAYASYADTTPDAIQGKRVSEIFPGYLKTTSFTNVAKTFLSGQSDTWMIHYDQDGLDLYNEMTAIKMADEVILHFADYTKLKYLEFELLNKITELENSNQNLEAFAHAASHDLKEPVRKIKVFTHLLQDQLDSKLSDQNRATFHKIISASERMGKLIDDLLLYSQFSLIPPDKEPVDLNENIKQVIEDLEVRIHESNATLVLGRLPVIHGYKRQLNQMFQNLISNSLKYRDPAVAPSIEISATTCTENGIDYAQLEIRDNGIGFEQQYAEAIFDLFTRLHNSGTQQGSGIGLSTVKRVVDNHQGIITAESQPGEGALFRICFPSDVRW
ncbi:PAS fold-containing protein [Dyadobacter soli]|uniref:histidine kinase n=1 Tax=Dyadobacter soli TaxID=659014 RepID=A0A1G7A9A9_9BACT|nr:ATP-binding protein [Dyadobacter soli]SDE11067.1 PAS fold-containing protein [Dyadobacter soli]